MDFGDLSGKKVLVIGLARTGRECARFLVRQGASVSVCDLRGATELKTEMDALGGLPIQYRLGGEQMSWLDGVDSVVPSPGVPMENPLLKESVARKIPVLSEIELASRFFHAPLIAITGTNGKSTTTTLIGAMLKADGRKTFLGGNLGAPFIGAVAEDWDWGVVEISSFQLEWVERFRPRIALHLNVTEDHLDRYPSFADYCHAKERIFAAQTKEDVAILNRDDPLVWRLSRRLRAQVVSFGFAEVSAGVFTSVDEIIWRGGVDEERYSIKKAKIQGVHNVENLMAAIAAAKCAGVSRRAIEKTLEEFPGLEHRLEFVREKDGVRYYNDSKGTNVGAVVKSLASFSAPVILLAGGVDKGGDYAPLADGVKQKVRRLVLFGAAKQIIAAELGRFTETVIVDDIHAAVRDAAAHARPGEIVLLSPACSSFDQFNNYAERGRVFKQLVQGL
ncbi:MAG TPA: UDP-N-acetylmuramoyl-L-alanine--D-glutamate ligase [Candidatus Limnocylindrales bacterium]|nr:UDP-N-acetylmuramoyl-L-alanine--D-glutamate ligase [Candidatus Limnocylindrales bacterium]